MGVTLVVAGIATAAALAAGSYALIRFRSRAEPIIYHFRCPNCGQKLRYIADRAGRDAKCSRCRSVGRLPIKLHAECGPWILPARLTGNPIDVSAAARM
jgi:DNA-directed RNA polymerase subunit RPC12/RpoP